MGHPLLLLINSTTTISSSSFKSQNFSFSPTTISPLPGKSFGFNSLNFRIQSTCHELHLTHRPRIHTATIHCSAKIQNNPEIVKERSISVILLAGGKGKKNGWFNPVFCALVVLVVASMPKQYLPLLGQPIALYSLYTFSKMTEVKEVIVVCDPSYKDIFEEAQGKINLDLKYALPGMERQDSVYSGLQEVSLESDFVCIHDSARLLVTSTDTEKVIRDGWINGAAVLGVPVKATIKEADNESFVVRTLDRKTLWEMQTPQVIKVDLLKKGFEFVNREALEVTDDVSIVEHLKHPVYITEGSYTNIKVTTPDDLLLAERILSMSSGVSPN